MIIKRLHPYVSRIVSSSYRSSRFSEMSTFTIKATEPEVLVKLDANLTEKELLQFPAFKKWHTTLQSNLSQQASNPKHPFHKSPYTLRSLTIQAIDRFGPRIGFIKLVAEVKNDSGESLPGAIFLRGASVGMMVLLQPDDVPEGSQDEKYVILTVQPRIAAGSLQFVELPAGMVDDGTFTGAAAKEIKEEIGLEIPESKLINLTELAIPEKLGETEQGEEIVGRGVFPSAGGCDEFIPLFLYEKRVPRDTLKEWEGRLTGLRDEGEKITLKLIRVEDIWRVAGRDAKALNAWALWEALKRNGNL